MDAFVGLLVLAAIAVRFVLLVRRTKAKAAAVQRKLDVAAGHRPAPLSSTQRKALGLQSAKPVSRLAATRPEPQAINPAPTRAIRNGWRITEVQFTYQDSEGEITTRTVTVHSVSASHIKGECHDKLAERTFRVDRVVGEVLDLDTGELLAAKKWVRNYS